MEAKGARSRGCWSCWFWTGESGGARAVIGVPLGERRVHRRKYERAAERQAKEADRAYWAGLSSDSRRLFLRLGSSLEHVREMGEGREGRRLILLPPRRRFIRRISCLIPLVLIVVAVETEQLPVAPVRWIIVVVVVLVMDGELAQLLAVKFTPAVRADPRK